MIQFQVIPFPEKKNHGTKNTFHEDIHFGGVCVCVCVGLQNLIKNKHI